MSSLCPNGVERRRKNKKRGGRGEGEEKTEEGKRRAKGRKWMGRRTTGEEKRRGTKRGEREKKSRLGEGAI